jgi:hypothetical protein
VDEPAIATKVDVTSAGAARSCLVSTDVRADAVVRRIGVSGISVTARSPSRRAVHGCDSTVARPDRGGWCGRAYGRLRDGRLTDPRLDLTCLSADGDPVAFVWVEPAEGTRFVAVRQPGFVEVYEVAGSLPVRVTTTPDLAREQSAATLEVSEHDRRGALLRAYSVTAHVAG